MGWLGAGWGVGSCWEAARETQAQERWMDFEIRKGGSTIIKNMHSFPRK